MNIKQFARNSHERLNHNPLPYYTPLKRSLILFLKCKNWSKFKKSILRQLFRLSRFEK